MKVPLNYYIDYIIADNLSEDSEEEEIDEYRPAGFEIDPLPTH